MREYQKPRGIELLKISQGLNSDKGAKLKEPEKLVAMRIVENYKEMFDFLDYNPVDDMLNAEELSQAFKDFGKI